MADRVLLNSKEISEIIDKISEKIYEDISGLEKFAIVGVQTRGVELSSRIRKNLERLSGREIKSGAVDITFHRDDLTTRGKLPEIKETRIDFDISDMTILLVDDVLFTGRTVKAAIEAIMTYGRPAAIKMFALIDRGNRELPLQADYCGLKIDTAHDETVKLLLSETDDTEDSVVLRSGK